MENLWEKIRELLVNDDTSQRFSKRKEGKRPHRLQGSCHNFYHLWFGMENFVVISLVLIFHSELLFALHLEKPDRDTVLKFLRKVSTQREKSTMEMEGNVFSLAFKEFAIENVKTCIPPVLKNAFIDMVL